MLEKVKRALRINHTLLDTDITDAIQEARSEMIRAGVPASAANSSDVLIERAIKTFCLANFSENAAEADKYNASWEYQLDVLRKARSYTEDLSDV